MGWVIAILAFLLIETNYLWWVFHRSYVKTIDKYLDGYIRQMKGKDNRLHNKKPELHNNSGGNGEKVT